MQLFTQLDDLYTFCWALCIDLFFQKVWDICWRHFCRCSTNLTKPDPTWPNNYEISDDVICRCSTNHLIFKDEWGKTHGDCQRWQLEILRLFLKIPNFSQLWQHRAKVVLHNRLELWLWRLGQVAKVWNIGSRLFIMVRFSQLCYFGQKRPLSCFLSLNFSQVLKQSLELWGLQRRRVGPK